MTTLVGGLLVLVGLAGSATRDPAPVPGDPPARGPAVEKLLAVVNNDPITLRDVEMEMQQLGRQEPVLREMSPAQLRVVALRNVVTGRMLRRAARDSKIEVGDEDVERRFEAIRRSVASEKRFRSMLAEEGMTPADLREVLAQDMARQQYLSSYFGAGSQARGPEAARPRVDLEPSPRELRRYYREHRDKDFTVRAAVHLRRVYVSKSRHPGPGEVRRRAEELLERARSGEDFVALARETSELGAENGGDLGWVPLEGESGYPREILDFASASPVGAVSDLWDGGPGFYFVCVEDRREGRVIPFSEAQAAIRRKLREERRNEHTEKMMRRLLLDAVIWPRDLDRALRAIR